MAIRDRFVGPGVMYSALGAGIVSALGILLVPSIARSFSVDVATAQWMLTMNLLCGVIATPIMGRLSDGRHARTVFMVSLGVVGVGSVVCAIAPDFVTFLVGRALQGPSYGLYPVAAAIVRRRLTGPALRSSLSGLAISGALGTGMGYPITGLLAELGSFRAAFWFGAVFMVTAIVMAWWVIDPDPAAPSGASLPRFDVWGAALLGGGLAPLLVFIAEGSRLGWTSPLALGLLALSVIVLTIWVLQALRTRYPLIDVRSLREPDVMLANLMALSFGMTIYVVTSGSGLVGQGPHENGYAYEWSVALAGLIMVPLTIGTYLANRIVGRLRSEASVFWSLPAGAAFVVIASLIMVFLVAQPWALFTGMFLSGAGMGMAYAALPLLIARRVDARDFGSAQSFNQLLRTVGGSIGAAVSGGVIAAFAAEDGFPDQVGIMVNFAIPGAIAAVVGLLLLASARRHQ